MTALEIPIWPYLYGGPKNKGKIKSIAADFIVEETLSFQPEGSGEHAFLQIQKQGENTEYVARLLARFAGVRQRDIGYAGLKDRHALTTQWFSVWLPGKDDPDWSQLETENIKVLESVRHCRKLKRGVLSGNYFELFIRDCQGDKDEIEAQLQCIKQQGFANYFAAQRFGHQGQNINKALAFLQGKKVKREQRSIYLSAIRSFLFNQILAKRIEETSWNKAVSGDVMVFDQSNSYFKTEQVTAELTQRAELGEIHPTGLMFGVGEIETQAKALSIENQVISNNLELTEGLIKQDVNASRRALRVFADNLQWEFQQDSMLLLSFSLPAGCYATSLLREIVDLSD